MKNHSKGNNNKNEIELLLREALRIKQKPSQEINDSIIRQHEKILSKEKLMLKGFRISSYYRKCKQKVLIEPKNIQVPVIKEPDTLDAEPMNV